MIEWEKLLLLLERCVVKMIFGLLRIFSDCHFLIIYWVVGSVARKFKFLNCLEYTRNKLDHLLCTSLTNPSKGLQSFFTFPYITWTLTNDIQIRWAYKCSAQVCNTHPSTYKKSSFRALISWYHIPGTCTPTTYISLGVCAHGPACIAFHCSHPYITNPGSVSHFAKTRVSLQTTTYINKSTKYIDIPRLIKTRYPTNLSQRLWPHSNGHWAYQTEQHSWSHCHQSTGSGQ